MSHLLKPLGLCAPHLCGMACLRSRQPSHGKRRVEALGVALLGEAVRTLVAPACLPSGNEGVLVERAARLRSCDRLGSGERALPVLPLVSARQWVLSVPKRLRPYLHHDVRVAGAVLQIFLRAIRATLQRTRVGPRAGAHDGTASGEGASRT